MYRKAWLMAALLIFLMACTPSGATQTPSSSPTANVPAATNSPTKPVEISTPTSQPSSTAVTPTETPTSISMPTNTQAAATNAPATSELGLSVTADHTAPDQFEQIPDEYIQKAAGLRLMFRGSSIAHNINMGLDCLDGDFGSRRPNYCSDFYDLKYDRSNWDFPVRGNPGWIQKVDDFIQLVNQNADSYDVFIFLVDYADGIDNATYPKISDPENFQTRFVDKIEALQAQHPDKIIVWTTMSMARTGFDNETAFNQMLRDYAIEHNKVLFDLADIESHSPDGTAEFDAQNREILYSGYTDEAQAGHLNATGRERVARSLWWFMARLAGWDGGQP
jgi:hypothetical protein